MFFSMTAKNRCGRLSQRSQSGQQKKPKRRVEDEASLSAVKETSKQVGGLPRRTVSPRFKPPWRIPGFGLSPGLERRSRGHPCPKVEAIHVLLVARVQDVDARASSAKTRFALLPVGDETCGQSELKFCPRTRRNAYAAALHFCTMADGLYQTDRGFFRRDDDVDA